MGCKMEAPLMPEEEECAVRSDTESMLIIESLPPWDAVAVLQGFFFKSLTICAMHIRIAMPIYDN